MELTSGDFSAFPLRQGGEHSGLGLPLAKACAGLLGGTCAARLEEGELVVEVRF